MKQYNNSALIVPKYTESQIYDGIEELQFPFSCNFMTYDKRVHEYFLTDSALSDNGMKITDAQERKELIKNTTRAVYSYIKTKAGTLNYSKMMYRIAKGLGVPNMSRLDFRTMFLEDILLVQAKDIYTSGYAKDAPKITFSDAGRAKANDLSTTDGYWLHDDVITALNTLNLTNPQRIRDSWGINWNEY